MAFLISYQQDFNEDSAVLFTSFHKGKQAFKKLKIACLRSHFKCKNHKKKQFVVFLNKYCQRL